MNFGSKNAFERSNFHNTSLVSYYFHQPLGAKKYLQKIIMIWITSIGHTNRHEKITGQKAAVEATEPPFICGLPETQSHTHTHTHTHIVSPHRLVNTKITQATDSHGKHPDTCKPLLECTNEGRGQTLSLTLSLSLLRELVQLQEKKKKKKEQLWWSTALPWSEADKPSVAERGISAFSVSPWVASAL